MGLKLLLFLPKLLESRKKIRIAKFFIAGVTLTFAVAK